MTLAPGDLVAAEFLALAERLSGARGLGPRRLAGLTGIPLPEQPTEAFASYRVYQGTGHFRGFPAAAELRAPRRRSARTPLLLEVELADPAPLSGTWLRQHGPPDQAVPPSPHADDEPEFLGYRRGDVLASLGVLDGRLTSLVLQVPG